MGKVKEVWTPRTVPVWKFLREKKGWSYLTFRFFPAEGIHPFDCFFLSLPAEGHKLSLEKPTDVGG